MNDADTVRSVAQPAREPFYWARLYVRRLSWPVTWLVLQTPLSANTVSVISIAVGAAGGLCFAFNSAAWNIAAVALLLLSWIFDCVDGEVARARGQTSLDGEFIDACRHQIVCPAVFAGITLGVYARHFRSPWLLALGLGSVALSTRFTGGMIDQMVLLGVRRALRRTGAAPPNTGQINSDATSACAPNAYEFSRCQAPSCVRFARLFRPLFVDFNIMHILIPAVVLDALGVQAGRWTPLDILHIAYGIAFPVVKLGSMMLAWKQGVSAKVEDVLRGGSEESPHH